MWNKAGGGICLESSPGQGSTFKIFFPRTKEIAPQKPKKAQNSRINTRFATILLVEDELELIGIAGELLKRHGYRVLQANSGPQAIDLMHTHYHQIDLLLTDVVMPEMGGGILAQKLLDKKPDLKVLFMSGYTDDAILKHGVESSKVKFLSKPFSSQELMFKVQETLQETL